MRLPLASAALLAIAFGATGAVTGKDSPLSSAELSRKVAAESASQQIVEPLADGRIRMTAPLQDLEARIGLDGAEFASTDDAGSGRFSWAVRGIGRTDAERSIASTGHVRVEDGATRVERDGFAETFTASADGLRHEIVVEKRPSGRGALVVEFDASTCDWLTAAC